MPELTDVEIVAIFHAARAEANRDLRDQPGHGSLALEYALRKVYEAGQVAVSRTLDPLECDGCQDDDLEHWRACPRWDAPENGGIA